MLPVPQKNFNLFRGVSLALVDDLRKGSARGGVGGSESRPATEPHAAGRGVSAAHLSPDLPQSPMLQGMESQPHALHLTCHKAPCCRAWSLSRIPFTHPQSFQHYPSPTRGPGLHHPPPPPQPSSLGLDKIMRFTLTAYSMLVALWTQRLHSE